MCPNARTVSIANCPILKLLETIVRCSVMGSPKSALVDSEFRTCHFSAVVCMSRMFVNLFPLLFLQVSCCLRVLEISTDMTWFVFCFVLRCQISPAASSVVTCASLAKT